MQHGFRCNNPNLGTVSLGDTGSSHYIAGSFFGNTVTLSATLTASTNAAGQTVITIALHWVERQHLGRAGAHHPDVDTQ